MTQSEDFAFFELKKESKSRSSNSKQVIKPANKSLSSKYIRNSKQPVTGASGSASSRTEIPKKDSGTKRVHTDDQPTSKSSVNKKTKPDESLLKLNNATPQDPLSCNEEKTGTHNESTISEEEVENIKKNDGEGDTLTPEISEVNKMKNSIVANNLFSKKDGKNGDTLTDDESAEVKEAKSGANELLPNQIVSHVETKKTRDIGCFCSPLTCGSEVMKGMNQTLERLTEEVSKFNEMNQSLHATVQDLKAQLFQGGQWSQATGSSSKSIMVDLGGTRLVDREWAEKIVWRKSESLKWKMESILNRIFTEKDLIHLWFDKTCMTEEQDKIFPEDCVEKLNEFFDEANDVKTKLEITKQQARIRERIQDKEQCERMCDQINTTLTMENEPLSRGTVRQTISKVLYDAKSRYRKDNNVVLGVLGEPRSCEQQIA
ncbi:uncharacterized protein LOC127750609 [Frankliniella occidentalis]|uniref:Uncharacterized protein LOC127750609 n=1 Tax=Frankliniella occidentalis TaxID=133901 RepID=A0A9C6X3Y5_FRAOC|nr:uncharacterized protein LOC127750609 [Frankliniella occidentalis]